MILSELTSLLASPSTTNFRLICDRIEATDADVALVLSVVEQLETWPDRTRYAALISGNRTRQSTMQQLGAAAVWLQDLRDGVYSQRLLLVRRVNAVYSGEFAEADWRDDSGMARQRNVVNAFAKRLDDQFAAPSVGKRKDEGDTFTETYGDGMPRLLVTSSYIEHAADYTYVLRYVAQGLGDDAKVQLEISARGETPRYELSLEGEASAVVDCALAWGEVLRRGSALMESSSVTAIAERFRASRS